MSHRGLYFYILPYLRIFDKQGRRYIVFDPLSCSIILYNMYKSMREGIIRKEKLFFISKLYWPLVAITAKIAERNRLIVLDIMGLEHQEVTLLSISEEYISKLSGVLKKHMDLDEFLSSLISCMRSIHEYISNEKYVIRRLIQGDDLRIIGEALRESVTRGMRRRLEEIVDLEKQFLIIGMNYIPRGGVSIRDLVNLCRGQWSMVRQELEAISRIITKLRMNSIIANRLSEMFSSNGKIVRQVQSQYENFIRRVREVVEENTREYRQAISEINNQIRRLRTIRSDLERQLRELDNRWSNLKFETNMSIQSIELEINDLRSRTYRVYDSYESRRIRTRINELERRLRELNRELDRRRSEYRRSRRRLEAEISRIDNSIEQLMAEIKKFEKEMNDVIRRVYQDTKYDKITRLYNEFMNTYNDFIKEINRVIESTNRVSKIVSLDVYTLDALPGTQQCMLLLMPIFSLCIGKGDKQRTIIKPPGDIVIKKGLIWTSLELRPAPKYIERIGAYIENLLQKDGEFRNKFLNYAQRCNYAESPTFKLGIKKKLKEVLKRIT